MRVLVALAIGYLLGSFLPADVLARSRGVDIRAVGTHNPGATNAFNELGVWPGLLAGAYDASVGLIAMWVAYRLGLPEGWVYAAGLSAVLGHVFPVFFGFRGGQGMAACVGMLVWGIIVAVTQGILSPAELVVLGVAALFAFALTRSASVVGAVAVPVLAAEILLSRPDLAFAAFMTVLSVWIWIVQVGMVREQHLWRLAEPVRERVARFHPPGR